MRDSQYIRDCLVKWIFNGSVGILLEKVGNRFLLIKLSSLHQRSFMTESNCIYIGSVLEENFYGINVSAHCCIMERSSFIDVFNVNVGLLLEETLDNVRSTELRVNVQQSQLQVGIHEVVDVVVREVLIKLGDQLCNIHFRCFCFTKMFPNRLIHVL